MNFDADQRATIERGVDGNMRSIATARYQHPPDARNIVARIEGVPANSIGSKGWRDANTARISSAITRRSVHAATERSGWTSIVTTDTSTILECLAANLDEAAHYCSSPDSHNACCRYDHCCDRNLDASYDTNDGGDAAADIALAWDGDSNNSHRRRNCYQQA
jgi:hypothetical protein